MTSVDLFSLAQSDRVRPTPAMSGGQPGQPPVPPADTITPAQFTLVLTPFVRRTSSSTRDVLYGLYQNQAPGALLVDADGNNPFPLDWFEDGTPAEDAGLRFFGVKFSDYILMRFGRQARTGSAEIVGPHLKSEVREGMHMRYIHGGLVGEINGISDPLDPYYFLPTHGNIGEVGRRAFVGNDPHLLQISYPNTLPPLPTQSFDWDNILWNQPLNEDKFSLVFDRVHSETHSTGNWQRDDGGSTTSHETGPGTNNTLSYYHIESSGVSTSTVQQRRIESSRFINDLWLHGRSRQLTIRACIQGSAFSAANTGLRVRQYGNLFTEGTITSNDLPFVDTTLRGWQYSNNYETGDTITSYGGQTHTCAADGGWVDFTFALNSSTSHVVINGEWVPSGHPTYIHQGDIAIRSVSMTGLLG